MGAATFVDVKGALLNYVRPNRELYIALKSGIYGARTVPKLMCNLDSFKEQFDITFPDYKKATTFNSTKFKGKTMEKDMSKKTATGLITVAITKHAISVVILAIYHAQMIAKKTTSLQKTNEEDFEKDSQAAEKALTASSNNPSPTLDPDPAAKELPDKEYSLMDLDSSPERYLPEKESVNKDLLHQVLAVNSITERQAIRDKALL
ncbi:hypothetical protein DSO57_1000168 [Entomophthora muscae]|uniref:Uncharacterized protein n=1 Tax=Entomophthora muscae TaxID=34485 RepID=A0ACC2T9D4_9FUNG|nr:hypothetical protein DSO57_1000168 [Entomophthora muscae]